MKFFSLAILLFLLSSTFSFSQKTETNPSSIPSDTIEGISNDSVVIYIIKKPPVTIREKVEIERTKVKQNQDVYMSFSGGPLWYTDKRKAQNSYDNYSKTLQSLTKPLTSYAIEWRVWKVRKKTITGISASGTRFYEEFNYTDLNGDAHKLINNFNYGNFALHIGRWMRKDKKISFIAHAGLALDYFISTKGFTLNKSDSTNIGRINRTMKYNKYSGSFRAGFSCLLALKNSFLEIEPYFVLAPFSATPKTEVYSLKRYLIGLQLGYVIKLF